MKGSTAFRSWTAPSALWLMCLHTQLCSFTPPWEKKSIIAKWLAREEQQRQKPGFEDWKEQRMCANLALLQKLSDDTAWGDDARVAVCRYYIRQMCIVLHSFRSLREQVWNRKHLVKCLRGRDVLQTPMNPARNISAYAAALHVYFYLVGNLSRRAPSRRKEPIWSSARTELLTLAQEMVGYKRWRHNQISEGSSEDVEVQQEGLTIVQTSLVTLWFRDDQLLFGADNPWKIWSYWLKNGLLPHTNSRYYCCTHSIIG